MVQNIQVIHDSIPGRLRLKLPQLIDDPSLARRLEQELLANPTIKQAHVSDLTASVLIHYTPSANSAAILHIASGALSSSQHPRQNVSVQGWWRFTEAQLFRELGAGATGLSMEEAERRRGLFGSNVLATTQPVDRWSLFTRQFNSLPIALLCASAAFSVVTGGLLDAVLVAGVVAANVVIGYKTESKAEAIINAFIQHERPIAIVRRDGQLIEISSDLLVPGDVILLMPGTVIAADARILVANELSIDESLLTGESAPVVKTYDVIATEVPIAERHNMAFAGTGVVSGTGLAIVVATGTHTEMGRIAHVIANTEQTQTPMQRQLDRLGTQLTYASLISSAAVFGLGALRGTPVIDLIRAATALAVAAIPEGLPTVATSVLATGLREMQQHHVLIRRLAAVETLGSVSVLCFDKTGTLTENRMTAVTIVTNSNRYSVLDGFPHDHPLLRQLLLVASLCSETEINHGRETSTVNGSPTESALILLAMRAGVDVVAVREQNPMIGRALRNEQRRYMKTVHRNDEGSFAAVKGNPLDVLAMCQHYMEEDTVLPLDQPKIDAITADNDDMMKHGLRVLGFAFASESGALIWLGMIGLTDPARPGIRLLIHQFHEAGIRTVMLTGDQAGTAMSIADEVGLADDITVLDGSEFHDLTAGQLADLVPAIDVFSRVSPLHKLDIVRALQQAGDVVAMTGDGTNDGPALRAADIGVSMGMNGTDAAREVADVILAEDDLTTMIVAIRHGRTIYSNIRKAVHFLVGTNSSEVMLTLAASTLGAGRPLNPAQLLWLNLVTDVAIAFSLGFEQPESDVMAQPPRISNEAIITARDYRRLMKKAGLFSASALATHFYGMTRYGPDGGGIAFTSLIAAQLFDGLSSRSETKPFWQLSNNPYLTRSIIGLLGVQAAAMLWPVSRAVLGVAPLDLLDLGVVTLGAGVPFLITETLSKSGTETVPLLGLETK